MPVLLEITIVRDKPNLFTCRQASSCPSGQLNGLLALQALVALLGVGDSFALAVRQAVAHQGQLNGLLALQALVGLLDIT